LVVREAPFSGLVQIPSPRNSPKPLDNHDPTSFGPDGDGTYSSGDPNVFSVTFLSPVPEADSAALLTPGLVLIWAARRREANGRGPS
jgi:hypothetical protein